MGHMTFTYSIRSGTHAPAGSDIQATGQALQAIEKANDGTIPVEAVIATARNSGSPLHPWFTWDVQQAAEERWRDQARYLVRSVRIETVEGPRNAYVNVRSMGAYVPRNLIAQRVDLLEEARAAARAEIASAYKALSELEELAARRDVPKAETRRMARARDHAGKAVALVS